MNLKWIVLILFVFAASVSIFVLYAARFGSRPSKEDRTRFEASDQYDKEKQIFQNQDREAFARMNKRIGVGAMIKLQTQSVEEIRPEKPLPSVKPNIREFLKPDKSVKAIWFGHSTLLFNIEGKTILVDPVFSNYASPFSFLIKRFQPAALSLAELPPIDYIVISHDHYDHLDIKTIKYFVNTKTLFIVPLGVGSHLKGWGIDGARITELDWWQKHEANGVSFIATPAQHFSGRSLTDRNQTLWSGWIFQNQSQRIFYSGDSGYGTHFKEIGSKHGPFDAAYIDVGQYNELWPEVHLPPEQALQAFQDVNARSFVPVHWGAFVLAKHSWYEPIERISQLTAEKKIKLLTPQLGEIMALNSETQTIEWWKKTDKNAVER